MSERRKYIVLVKRPLPKPILNLLDEECTHFLSPWARHFKFQTNIWMPVKKPNHPSYMWKIHLVQHTMPVIPAWVFSGHDKQIDEPRVDEMTGWLPARSTSHSKTPFLAPRMLVQTFHLLWLPLIAFENDSYRKEAKNVILKVLIKLQKGRSGSEDQKLEGAMKLWAHYKREQDFLCQTAAPLLFKKRK